MFIHGGKRNHFFRGSHYLVNSLIRLQFSRTTSCHPGHHPHFPADHTGYPDPDDITGNDPHHDNTGNVLHEGAGRRTLYRYRIRLRQYENREAGPHPGKSPVLFPRGAGHERGFGFCQGIYEKLRPAYFGRGILRRSAEHPGKSDYLLPPGFPGLPREKFHRLPGTRPGNRCTTLYHLQIGPGKPERPDERHHQNLPEFRLNGSAEKPLPRKSNALLSGVPGPDIHLS